MPNKKLFNEKKFWPSYKAKKAVKAKKAKKRTFAR